MRLSRLVAVVLLVGAVVCAVLGLRRPDVASGGAGPALATPLWSARRVPQPVVEAVGAQRLQAELDDSVAGEESCVVVNDGTGVVAVHNSGAALIPASTVKLLTGAAVLNELGPDFQFTTNVVAEALPADGMVPRLWLVGAGDPGLSTPSFQSRLAEDPETIDVVTTSLAQLADAVVAAGVRNVPGGIAGDDSRYETLRFLPTWRDSYRTEGHVGPLGALTVDHGFSAFEPDPVPVDDPAIFAATKLTDLLEARGVAVGAPGHETAPAGAVPITGVESPPLAEIVGSFLSASDNLAGELFARELGVRVANQGTTAAGTQVILDELQELGVATDGVTLVDGSGLDRGNRATCPALASALALGARPRLRALWDGLAIAGRKGTLVDEMEGSVLAGRLRGKTGSLAGVTGLAALIDGRSVTFAYLASGDFSESGGFVLREEIAEIIDGFPNAPPADALVPGPATSPP